MTTPQTRPEPQLLALTDFFPGITSRFSAVVAYKTVGTKVYIASPYLAGNASQFLDFQPSGMVRYAIPPTDYIVGYTATHAVPTTLKATIDPSTLQLLYAGVQARTIGNGVFPAYELHSQYGKVTDPLYIMDTVRVWVECPSCTPKITSQYAPEATNSIGGIRPFALFGSGWQLAFNAQDCEAVDGPLMGRVVGFDWHTLTGPTTQTEGFAVETAGISDTQQWILASGLADVHGHQDQGHDRADPR